MGLSASQARLLTLTSRKSDLELRAQRISNQKVRLADQSTEASKAYTRALDKQTMEVYSGSDANGNEKYIKANAFNLTNFDSSSDVDINQRFIKDSYGRLVIDSKEAAAYEACGGNEVNFLHSLAYSQFDTTDAEFTAANVTLPNNLTNAISTAVGSINPSSIQVLDDTSAANLNTANGFKNAAVTNQSNAGTATDWNGTQYKTLDISGTLANMNSLRATLTTMLADPQYNGSSPYPDDPGYGPAQKAVIQAQLNNVNAVIATLNQASANVYVSPPKPPPSNTNNNNDNDDHNHNNNTNTDVPEAPDTTDHSQDRTETDKHIAQAAATQNSTPSSSSSSSSDYY